VIKLSKFVIKDGRRVCKYHGLEYCEECFMEEFSPRESDIRLG